MKEKISLKTRIGLLLITIGIVYGDIGTSPMYVMKSIIEGNGGLNNINEEFIIGSLSLVIWTVTLLTTVKYVLIAMKADNHGEGGIFSLYTLVKNCGKWMIVPGMIGGAALLADGVLTPAVTVTTAVEGLRSIELMNRLLGTGQVKVVVITVIIISLLFSLQHAGTSRIGRAFGPVMLIWFCFLGISGFIGMTAFPAVLKAFNPVYAAKVLFSSYNKAGLMILGSVFLATTGAEALYSDMSHVGRDNIYISWPFVKICLILNYLGQGAWIIQSRGSAALAQIEDLNPFYMMLPEAIRPFAVIISAAAAIIASQALITGSFTLVSEAIHLNLMPHLEIRYPSDTKGQLYIDKVNKILWIGCLAVVLYFRSGARIEAAYGLAITLTMLMTTLLLFVYLRNIKKLPVAAFAVLIVFGAIESIFFISSLGKFTAGGYVTVLVALMVFFIELIWYKGTMLEEKHSTKLQIVDYLPLLKKLHDDENIPLLADNLVYLTSEPREEHIDRDILYSILDKDSKRAKAYWFVDVNVLDEPSALSYSVKTFGTDYVFWVELNLGFKCNPLVNVYLRQIVRDLENSGELPKQSKKYSIYGNSDIGNFKFCQIHKIIPTKTGLSRQDEFILNTKYAIRKLSGSKIEWYGLDTSSVITEKVPILISPSNSSGRIRRVE